MRYKESEFGLIPEYWDIQSTFDYCKIITDYVANGSFKSLADHVIYNQGEKYAVLIRLTDYHNEFQGEYVYINKHAYDFLGKTKLYGEEIIIANVGANVGTVFLVPKLKRKMSLGPNSIMIKTNGNDKFYYYWFKSRIGQGSLQSIITGSAQPKFNKTAFRRVNIPVPPIIEQKNIAYMLSSLDDKIDLNKKINKNLEELAQTLYKRWFVDFEFPNEKGEPYKSSGGEMVDSDLGLIPKGWEVKNVSDMFVFIGGSQPPKEEHIYEYKPGYVRFIQNRDFREDPKHITFIKNSNKNKMANKLDILIDKYGEVGQIRFGIEGAYNVALAKIEPNLKSDLELLRGYFSQREIREYLSNSSIASTRGSLNSTTFTGLKIAYPSKLLIRHFSEFNQNVLISILNKKNENKKLSELRDLLLPKLMSGEIEVPLEE